MELICARPRDLSVMATDSQLARVLLWPLPSRHRACYPCHSGGHTSLTPVCTRRVGGGGGWLGLAGVLIYIYTILEELLRRQEVPDSIEI